MLLPRDMKEEAEGVLGLLPTQVALERLAAVVSHVYGVHGAVLERNPTKFTRVLLAQLLRPVEGEQTRHVGDLLLGVGVEVKPPLYLVRLALASVLGGAGGKAGTAGVTPRVTPTLVITGAPVRSKSPSDDVVVTLLAEVQHPAGGLALLCQLGHFGGVQRGENVRFDSFVWRQRSVLSGAGRVVTERVWRAGQRVLSLPLLHQGLDGGVGDQPLQQGVGDGDLVEVVHGTGGGGGHWPLHEHGPRRLRRPRGVRAGGPLPGGGEGEVGLLRLALQGGGEQSVQGAPLTGGVQ